MNALSKPPLLTVTEYPSIGSPAIRIEPEVPSRTMEVTSLDRYVEEIALIHRKLDAILTRIHTPWYKRFYDWIILWLGGS